MIITFGHDQLLFFFVFFLQITGSVSVHTSCEVNYCTFLW